ncbi:hypothetical protein [Aeromonas caviae]|uniref:hypothetical protein n=1 Tax=Aeromonas caviae TaxID=648 RepID=UPI00059EB843|nr:hypothetical protein [Aeromonas caviae]
MPTSSGSRTGGAQQGIGGEENRGTPFPFLFQGTAVQRLQQAIHDPAKQMLADPDGLLSVDGSTRAPA